MPNVDTKKGTGDQKPSAWIQRFAPLIPKSQAGGVLDIACGNGRHTKPFLEAGHHVVAVDRDTSGIKDLASNLNLKIMEADLETAGGWPFAGHKFAGVVVTNYLYRPILNDIVAAVGSGGGDSGGDSGGDRSEMKSVQTVRDGQSEGRAKVPGRIGMTWG